MEKAESFHIFKIIVAGDTGVGKTTLIQRYVDGYYKPAKRATIGIDYFLKNIKLTYPGLESTIALQIWDLAGEEKYRSFLPVYLPGTHGVILVYSDDRKLSLQYLTEFLDVLKNSQKERIPLILIKGKNDLEKDSLPEETVQALMKENRIDFYYLTSSKTGQNINEIFLKITELILKQKNLL